MSLCPQFVALSSATGGVDWGQAKGAIGCIAAGVVPSRYASVGRATVATVTALKDARGFAGANPVGAPLADTNKAIAGR